MSEEPARSSTARPGFRLLVVDDNDDNRNVLSRRLRSKGYEVDIAEDGASALAACEANTYDAVLLDMMMPGMSGLEVLAKLRERHGKTELSVIMATAKTDSGAVVDALKQGANDYVTKPIDFPVLLARLESHLTTKAEAADAAKRAAAQVDVTFGIAPGTVLANRYEILEKRGEGGFAVVYRARQLSTNREVALKHLRPDVLGAPNNAAQIERFDRESKLIGELNHPNVVRLIDSGSVSVRPAAPASKRDFDDKKADDPNATPSQTRRRPPDAEILSVPFIVMELLCGEPLCDLIEREAPLEPARAVDLILPVLSALNAAHEKGVVHRDVKPSNIMLTTDDRGAVEPKVLDFGIAKLTTREANLTVSASLIGTPQYMPPEQAMGKKDLDGRADQFSAAGVLYQMLTGRALYAGDSLLELVGKVLEGTYMPLAEARPGLSPELVAVVSRALSTDRSARHTSMNAFGRALLPFATERAARQWTDHFAVEPKLPDPEPDVVDVVRSEPPAREKVLDPPTAMESPVAIRESTPIRVGPTDATVQVAPTLQSKAPKGSAKTEEPPKSEPAPLEQPPMSWERVALMAIAIAVACWALARYVF